MALQGPIPVEFGNVFTHGAFAAGGFEPMRDFDASSGDRFVQAKDNGTPPHPDTITRRFHKLSADAGLPKINLHDVRHSYATAGRDAKIDWKALSQRIGHSDVAFTMKQYVQIDLQADRQVANTLAELIIGGSLTSVDKGPVQMATTSGRRREYKPAILARRGE
jgi:Phage integrase family